LGGQPQQLRQAAAMQAEKDVAASDALELLYEG